MPLHALTHPFARFRGTIQPPNSTGRISLYDSAHAGLVSSHTHTPTAAPTATQAATRARVAACASSFKTLSIAQIAAWSALADQLQKTNALEIPYVLNAMATHSLVNSYRLLAGLAITPTAPAFAERPGQVFTVAFFIYVAPTFRLYVYTPGCPTGYRAFVRLTSSIARQSAKLKTRDLRIAPAATSDAFRTLTSTGFYLRSDDLAHVTLVGNQYCGFEITLLTAAYLPVAKKFIPQQWIQWWT